MWRCGTGNTTHMSAITGDDISFTCSQRQRVITLCRKYYGREGPSHSRRQRDSQRQQAKQFQFLIQPEFLLPNSNPPCGARAPAGALLRRMHSHLQRASALFSPKTAEKRGRQNLLFPVIPPCWTSSAEADDSAMQRFSPNRFGENRCTAIRMISSGHGGALKIPVRCR